ncbi:hypothetical protein PLEOSDRAFT_171892 [Pleurotus ostreatus PC15]|uniref:Uncharacterized protein n=1 Tax=Pleurotus ostreatus (strain PC15) TaxID=1137138 RepID=A0A067N3V6_PLEO1|nr:hypothetical protein PLEOSDRAFT_171892 [Pleurotus ostreatus PC15]
MLMYKSPKEKMKYMTEMACKIVMNAKELCEENLDADADEIGEDLQFLEKVVEQMHSTCRAIVARTRGEALDEQMDESWDEISDKVSLIVESSMDVDDDPAPRKRKRKGDKENTIGRLPNGENGDKSVRKRKGKGTQKGNGGCTAKDANDNARNGGGGKASQGSNEASKRSGEAAQESDASVDKEIQAEQEEEENREYLFQVKYRRQYIKMKLAAENDVLTVMSLWTSINRDALRDHRLEENDAYWRLLAGYGTPTIKEFDAHFGAFVDSQGSFQEQVNWDKRIDQCPIDGRIESRDKLIYKTKGTHKAQYLVHNILSTMMQIKQAIDWKGKETEWKTAYTNRRFRDECKARIEEMKSLKSPDDYKQWLEAERKKFKDRQGKSITARNWALRLYAKFGSIVLLDPRWNPELYGKSNRSDTFGKFLDYMDDHPIYRKTTWEEAVRYDGNVVEVNGDAYIDAYAGNQFENNKMVLGVVRYVTKDEEVVAHVNEFIKKKVE